MDHDIHRRRFLDLLASAAVTAAASTAAVFAGGGETPTFDANAAPPAISDHDARNESVIVARAEAARPR